MRPPVDEQGTKGNDWKLTLLRALITGDLKSTKKTYFYGRRVLF